jgi:hypothetical protein
MRLSLSISAAAIAFFALAPIASALTLQTAPPPAAGDGQVPDPNDVRPHLQGQPREDSGVTTKIGNSTFHFGMSSRSGADYGGNSLFLDSPASRTVPSQAR